MNMNKAFIPSKNNVIKERWILLDGKEQCVGRLATKIVSLVRGKDQVFYDPSVKCGAHVVVINGDKVIFSGDKSQKKTYRFYTGYVGNDRTVTAEKMAEKNSCYWLKHAVKGMLKKNRLESQLWKTNVKIYAGSVHPHSAQIKKEEV